MNALSELQFPPTQEAFANPLQSLRDDVTFKHEAMWFLVQRTTDQSSHRHLHSSAGTPRKASDDSINTQRIPNIDLSRTSAHEYDIGQPRSPRSSTPSSQHLGKKAAGSAVSSRSTPRTPTKVNVSARSTTSPYHPSGVSSGYGDHVWTEPSSPGPQSVGDYHTLYQSLQVYTTEFLELPQNNFIDFIGAAIS